MEYCIRTQRRNKWPDGGYKCTVNRETEKAAEEKSRKKKGTREQEKVSGIERKGTDSEECRQLKISAEWSVITESGRQTASFFCFFSNSKIKTLINLNQQGSQTSPFICQTLDGEGLFLLPLVHSSHRGRRHPSRGMLGNLAWPETWRWWTDGGGTLCYLLLT